MQGECNSKTGKLSFTRLDTAEPQLILYKDNANERKKSLLLFSRVQLILCKTSAAMDNIPYLNDATRLARLHECMENRADVCSSGGVVSDFPQRMYDGFINFGIGLIVCHDGDFDFILSDKTYTAKHGETVFMTEHTYFRIVRKSRQLQASIIIYKTEPIRYVIGTIVQSVQIYARMSPELPCVWSTGCENDISRYISLIGNDAPQPENMFAASEQKMLLMSLTYRLCRIFSNKFFAEGSSNARRTEVFLKLIQLIGRHYMTERGVAFYAGQLFLSPKYLSELSKSMCGYTVQQLVFKAITRKAMSLLDSTNMTVAEIADKFRFPNPSSFGTFFRKQTGMSPQKYRERL